MKVPKEFPDGCRFIPTFGGDWFVEFPDGRVFKLADDGINLTPARGLPAGGIVISEDPTGFIAAAIDAAKQNEE